MIHLNSSDQYSGRKNFILEDQWLALVDFGSQHFDFEILVQYIILELSEHFVMFIPRDELTFFLYCLADVREGNELGDLFFLISLLGRQVAELGGFWQLQIH